MVFKIQRHSNIVIKEYRMIDEVRKKLDEKLDGLKMIGEINRRLKNGETVELECIDVEGLGNSIWGLNKSMLEEVDRFVVSSVYRDWVNINDDSFHLDTDDLKYFKIKENDSKKTFNDLFNLVVQAIKDGVIDSMILSNEGGVIKIFYGDQFSTFTDNSSLLEENIKFVKSLYDKVTTLEIDSEECMYKLIKGAIIELTNGSKLKFIEGMDDGAVITENEDGTQYILDYQILKGSKVKQRKYKWRSINK